MYQIRSFILFVIITLFIVTTCFADTTVNITVQNIASKYLFRAESAVAVLKISAEILGDPVASLKFNLSNAQANFTSTIFEKISIYEDDLVSGTVDSFDSVDILREVKTLFSSTSSLNFTIASGNQLATGNHTFFVVYDVISSAPLGTNVEAQLSSVTITTSNISTATVVGTFPAPSTPPSMKILDGYTLTVNAVAALLNHPVYQGSTKVPVLALKLTKLSTELGDTVTLKFRNAGTCPYSLFADGISRVWLYKDNPGRGTIGDYDGQDLLISASTTFSNGGMDMQFSNIPLELNSPVTFNILYDVGLTASGTFNINLLNIEASGSLYTAQTFPHSTVVSQKILSNPLVINSIESNYTVINKQTSGNIIVTINISNNSGSPLSLTTVAPAFYYNDINGQDISAEYLLESNPLTINTGATLNIPVTVLTTNISADGIIYIDAIVQIVSADITATLVRYQVATNQYTKIVSGSGLSWVVELSRTAQSWHTPAHVLTINMVYGSTMQYESGDPVQSGAKLNLYFNQNAIDESTFQVSYAGSQCVQVAGSASSIYQYTYDSSTGMLSTQVPTTSGTLLISVRDKTGAALSDLSLSLVVSDKLVLDNLLLYPNPFLVDSANSLIFSFLTNKASTYLDLYVIDAAGRVVWASKANDNYFSNAGYNEYKWLGRLDSGKYIASGIYSVRAILRDSQGNKATGRAKLAVR